MTRVYAWNVQEVLRIGSLKPSSSLTYIRLSDSICTSILPQHEESKNSTRTECGFHDALIVTNFIDIAWRVKMAPEAGGPAWVTQLLTATWGVVSRYGWYMTAIGLLIYIYGPTAYNWLEYYLKVASFDRSAAAERERQFEEERRRKIEEMQYQLRLDAERKAEEKKQKEADAALAPRAEKPAADEKKPKDRREYNPLLGHSSQAARITNTMRQRRGGG